ncbi:9228_t:CDS:2, partial [Racocetra fulgida]
DGFDVTKVSNLISKAKTLNSYISDKDKYRESHYELQAELNPQPQVNPLSNDTRTHELAKLLHPFTQATGYIGGSQYPTLGMMISTLIKLLRYLREFYPAITSQTIKKENGGWIGLNMAETVGKLFIQDLTYKEIIESLQPTKTIMQDIFKQLELKGENFFTFKLATDQEIECLWELVLELDDSLVPEDMS